MNPSDPRHAQGITLFTTGQYNEALDFFRKALADADSSELWNDWAAAQFVLGRRDEAEAGFRLAVELAPQNGPGTDNLNALVASQGYSSVPAMDESALRQFLPLSCSSPNEQSYFETHKHRYVETLNLLPDAKPDQRVLELGAAFHHVTAALARFKGYAEVRCNDIWQGEKQTTRELALSNSNKPLLVKVDNFDVQATPWPYDDSSFDVVLFCEMLEHLHSDPIGVLSEINRVLRDGGYLLLTTPNLSSGHSVEYALRGESPYVYGKFEPHGASTDRHNREYTPGEVRRLALAAGFDCQRLETRNSWWQVDRSILRLLASRGEPIALRGDNILLLAQKTCSVRDRYPEEFYLRLGTQADRRRAQHPESSPVLNSTAEVPPVSRCLNLLVIHELVPHFDQSGSDLRLLDVLKELRAQSHRVTVLARDAKNAARYTPELEALGIRVIAGDPSRMKHLGQDQPTNWSLEQLLHDGKFDAAILCQWFWSGISIPEHYLDEIRRISPSTRIAVLSDDRHGERERRAAKVSGQFSDLERAEDFESRELVAYRAADLLLYITEADRAHFSRFVTETPMELLPLVAPVAATSEVSNAERSGVLFLGNFDNLANRDALEWFLREVWPLVRKRLPDLGLRVAGNACPENIVSEKDGVTSLGKIDKLASAFAGALAFASPIRFGTGINTKNLQALAHGVPTVTTSVGAEGLRLRDGHHALLADTPLAFAGALCRICTEPNLWRALSANGQAFVATEFSRDHLSRRLRNILGKLIAQTPKKPLADLGSYRAVEQFNPDVLRAIPSSYRLVLRTFAYWQLGSAALARSDHREALDQFRHVFTSIRRALPDTVLHRRLLGDMAAAYRAGGDSAAAQRCEDEKTKLVALGKAPRTAEFLAKPGAHTRPLISVVLPTFNRRHTLELCLAALAFQTLPAERWEVVVVDDGSTDDTVAFLSSVQVPFTLNVFQQFNRGAGAARRAGVEAARGELVLLCNDDTIASSTLLEEHLRLQSQHANSKVAILGHFYPSSECGRRALSFWINHSPFFFPQHTLKPGEICGSALFVTCNLSIRRQAILEAGNFDADFRVAEDTEMGARLERLSYRVRFEPSAVATHEHSKFTTDDLLRRAALYGSATLHLLRKHPQLLGDGTGPFGRMTAVDLERIESIREEKAAAADSGVAALRALDDFDILPLWMKNEEGIRPIDALFEKVGSVVPVVYWHFLFESLLAEAARERSGRRPEPAPQMAVR